MVKKPFILLFLYFLVLFQISFLPHFRFFWSFSGNNFFNLVFLVLLLINLLEKKEENFGILFAFFAGFLLDIFSESFIGFHVLLFVLISLFIKFFLKQYVQIGEQKIF